MKNGIFIHITPTISAAGLTDEELALINSRVHPELIRLGEDVINPAMEKIWNESQHAKLPLTNIEAAIDQQAVAPEVVFPSNCSCRATEAASSGPTATDAERMHGPHYSTLNYLIGEFDAKKWAEAFVRLFPSHDLDSMIGWFANAIMSGYDYAQKASRENGFQATEPGNPVSDLKDVEPTLVEEVWRQVNAHTPENPSYYSAFAVSPVDLIAAYKLNFFDGNVVKYIARANYKNGLEDKFKALWYVLHSIGVPKDQIEQLTKGIRSSLEERNATAR